jgi:hypothetical protein
LSGRRVRRKQRGQDEDERWEEAHSVYP